MTLSWHVAALNNQRRLPQLSKLLIPETIDAIETKERRSIVQTPEQQISIALQLNSMFGGTVEYRSVPSS